MAPVHGPDTADGRPERSDTGEHVPHDTLTITRSALANNTTDGAVNHSGLATIAQAGQSDEPALVPGEQLGRFKIERQLGAGGMGQVFAARDLESGEIVALKYLERTSASMLYRFKQEFRALAGVTHENLVALGELIVLPDAVTFFTMELVDGVAFDEYVRGRTPKGQLPNIARLKRALRQLIAGVQHLHRNDCIHRDLKPSNVLVTSEGRVVILDFGLVQDHSEAALSDDPEDQIMGTPAYMSPEQAGLERTGPASDYYAVGVMLYECLTGKRPFLGTLTHLLFAKRELEAPDVTELVSGVPDELARMCRRLLTRTPGERPGPAELFAMLDGDTDFTPEPSPDMSMTAGRAAFVGRRRELDQLEAAFATVTSEERQVTVHVHGRSGYGKSALVREFLAGAREAEGAVLLRGRCLERESVPYKGVDAVVDALSVYLRQLPREDLLVLQPEHPAALVRLFPVLGDLWAADQTRTAGIDAHELRQRAFAALRQLFAGLGERGPLVVFVDDFHWGNVDSARLLKELARPPGAPVMLLIVAFRDEVESNESLQALTAPAALAERDVREVFIGPLAQDAVRELALMLMGEGSDAAKAERFAAGAEGSPFYVSQMVHGAGAAEGTTPGQLDQLVVRRILQLDADSRRLLEVVAVAGGPVSRRVAFDAAELDDPARLLPALREAELLRLRARGDDGPSLETAHARIREVTVGELDPGDLRETHLRLAEALERHASDPEALAEHFERGGDVVRAADYFERAAEQAANSLAFRRAVSLYRRTLDLLAAVEERELGVVDGARVRDLRSGLAEQLINIGRGHEAAQLLLSLAEQTEHSDAPAAREFRRRAADQMIKTGHVDEGLAELDKLLRTVGLRLPSGKAASLSALVWEQARLKLRGFDFIKREADEIPAELLDQADTCFAVVNGLSTQEVLLSAMFHLRNLRLSLIAGEPYRVARALAYQCVIEVAGRDWSKVEDHFRVARELAAEVGDPQLAVFIDVCEASVHWFERRYPTSTRLHSLVLERSEGLPGAAWEQRTAHIHHMWTLVCQGRFGEFRQRATGTIERARERGDMQEMVEVSSFEAVVRVLTGDPEGARRLLAEAQADWNPGRYLFGDVWCFYAHARRLMWEGEPEEAVALAKETLAQMRRTFLDQNMLARHNVQELLCRAYLNVGLLRKNQSYARRARRLAAKLRGVGNPVITAQCAAIDAGLASMAGDREGALGFWSEAEELFASHEMDGAVAAVRMRQAQVLGHADQGPRLESAAWAYFRSEGIEGERAIDGFLRVIAPADMDALKAATKA